MLRSIVVVLSLLMASATSAYAESDIGQNAGATVTGNGKDRNGFYFGFGLGASGIEYSQPNLNLNYNGAMVILKVGYDYNEYLGAEVRLGGAAADKQTVGASTVEMGAGFGSLFLKPMYPFTGDFRMYGLVGITNASFERKQITTAGVVLLNDTVTKNGFSFGAGIEYDMSDRWSLGAEWVQYWTNVEIRPTLKATIWGVVGNINFYF